MKRSTLPILVIVLLVPNLVFAAWWNPFTWFKQDSNSDKQQVQQTLVKYQEPVNYSQPTSKTFYVQADNTRVHDCASLSCKVIANYPTNTELTLVYASATDLPDWVQFTFPDSNGATTTGYIKSTMLGENRVVIQKVVPTGTLCNGDYYNQCPSGQNFVCPSTGKAYCDTPKTNDQMCEDKYGSNSYFVGQKTCGCKTGYGWNSTQTSCVAVQVKNGYQSCSESFPNETWDGTYGSNGKYNCICQNGYIWNSIQAICVSYQQQYLQQAVDKSNSVACQTAKQNQQIKQKELDDFEASNAPNLSLDTQQGQGGLIQNMVAQRLSTYVQAVSDANQAENRACLP